MEMTNESKSRHGQVFSGATASVVRRRDLSLGIGQELVPGIGHRDRGRTWVSAYVNSNPWAARPGA
jgi:hypothetical protein